MSAPYSAPPRNAMPVGTFKPLRMGLTFFLPPRSVMAQTAWTGFRRNKRVLVRSADEV